MKPLGILTAAAIAAASLPITYTNAEEEVLKSIIFGNVYRYTLNKDDTVTLVSAELFDSSQTNFIPKMIENHPLTAIAPKAFSGRNDIKEITIPSNIKTIGEKAFMSCSNLTKVTFEDGVKAIPDDCFFSCPKLKNVNIPDSVEKIGKEAFFSCNELDIVVPPTVKSIGKDALGKEAGTHKQGSVSSYGFLIIGERGSEAENYAKNYNVDFFDPNNFVLGDMDGDYKLDSIDASLVLVEYARVSTGAYSGLTKRQKLVGDINGDRAIDSSDASVILRIYSLNSTGGGTTTAPVTTTITTTSTTTTSTETTTTTEATTTVPKTSKVIYTKPVYTAPPGYPTYPSFTTTAN